jgi:hypothetical protein
MITRQDTNINELADSLSCAAEMTPDEIRLTGSDGKRFVIGITVTDKLMIQRETGQKIGARKAFRVIEATGDNYSGEDPEDIEAAIKLADELYELAVQARDNHGATIEALNVITIYEEESS